VKEIDAEELAAEATLGPMSSNTRELMLKCLKMARSAPETCESLEKAAGEYYFLVVLQLY